MVIIIIILVIIIAYLAVVNTTLRNNAKHLKEIDDVLKNHQTNIEQLIKLGLGHDDILILLLEQLRKNNNNKPPQSFGGVLGQA